MDRWTGQHKRYGGYRGLAFTFRAAVFAFYHSFVVKADAATCRWLGCVRANWLFSAPYRHHCLSPLFVYALRYYAHASASNVHTNPACRLNTFAGKLMWRGGQ